MKLIGSSFCIFALLFFCSSFTSSVRTCIPTKHPAYGDTTRDYDIRVGSDLIVNCTLNEGPLPNINIHVNSSRLAFKKDGEDKFLTDKTFTVDSRMARLRIPNAKVEDSGVYHCWILLPEENKHVCLTGVYVGYPPKNVTNFKCLSRNFDNLTCTWDVEPSLIRTNYTVQKELFLNYLQDCPQHNNQTFCQWRDNTDPPFTWMHRNLTFFVHGNNSLGSIVNEFNFDLYEIVIPNQPENFSILEIDKNSVSIQWKPPTMTHSLVSKPVLYYQLWLQELGPESEDKIVIEAGAEAVNYTFANLIPHYLYNVSVRCRVDYTKSMWSPLVSDVFRTNADVPYSIPEVNPEGFVIHNFGIYRNTTLYWKPVSERFHNGEDFHYHIVYSPIKDKNASTDFVNSEAPYVKVGHLHNDTAYAFHIYSANSKGISKNFKTIIIDDRDKILPSVKDIRAISNGIGHYNLSWSKADFPHLYYYTVFWCASRKPGHCEGPIQWSAGIVEDSKFSLNVSNVNSNFQFAVASTHNNRSSGMQWASCIVPRKAPLGQIPITHIEPYSRSLQVRWKLDCEAQKSVIDRYVITYCKEGKNCTDAVAKSDVLSYSLKGLHPFSNYSIKLRAFNKENKPSEDTDEMYQRTLSAEPSDPPRNVAVISRSDSSFSVSWAPPLEPNGIITHYFIYHNEQKNRLSEVSCKTCVFHIKGLREFTVYNVSIEACVGEKCSTRSAPVSVRTDVGVPGKMHPPLTEKVNTTHLKISWSDPFLPNGPIEMFEIQWQPLDSENMTESQFSRSQSTIIKVECPNLLEGGLTYHFSVRAANVKNGTTLYGPFSDPAKDTACAMSQGLAMIIGVAIGGTFALAIFLLFLYKLVIWMSEKIHQVKNIAVRLPKELEGPETNPLNNYESFKNGLVQSIHNGKQHLPYALDDSDNKNRHGSGSSQFSNASTDELIFKNGKCTKFGRKPSGDSSGCSSMTSNTTTRMQLSSDSGTESDFMVPSSPDSISNDLSVPNGHKPHMPILMEINDSPETASGEQGHVVINTSMDKYNNFINGMVLKVDHPYSKFGITGSVTSSIPCQINPLAFYSCNLANSEPSVFEAQASNSQESARPMYSKMGFAKSSGDILGMNKEMGYSKFGLAARDCFSIDVENLNPIVGMALVGDCVHPGKSVSKSLPGNRVKENSSTYPVDCKGSSKEEWDVREELPVSNRPSSGYVQVGDIRSMREMDNISLSTSFLEEDNSPLQIPEDLADDLSDLSSVWTTGLFQLPPTEITGDSYSPNKSGHLPNGGLTLPSSSSPSAGCLHVLPSSGVCATDNISGNRVNESNYNSNSHAVSEVCDVAPGSSSPSGQGLGNQSGKCTQSPEVLLRPGAGRNGYVPFSALSSLCDPPVSIVPNSSETNIPLSIFPGDISTDQNYITPSNKGELKLLQEGLISSTKPFSPMLHCNGSMPLKHFLKPLPKMESEICEV